jgi:hypothetical protein
LRAGPRERRPDQREGDRQAHNDRRRRSGYPQRRRGSACPQRCGRAPRWRCGT